MAFVMANLILLLISFYFVYRIDALSSLIQLKESRVALHLFAGSTLTLSLLAILSGGISPQMPLHFMGIAAITLIIGYRLSVTAALIVIGVQFSIGKLQFDVLGISLFCGSLLPIMLLQYWVRLTQRSNIWFFTFITAGFGSLLLFVAKTLGMASYYYWVLQLDSAQIIAQYILVSSLFWVPEILLSVTIILTCLQHRPQWVACFEQSPN